MRIAVLAVVAAATIVSAEPKETPLFYEKPDGATIPHFGAPPSLSPLIKTVRPAVVNISTDTEKTLGSGFIISPDGYVVTNKHVVAKTQELRIKLPDGRRFGARMVGQDASTDVALLKLEGEKVGSLPFVYLGDSDRIEVGDWVLAIGNPFGYDQSVTHGLISAKERAIGVGMFDDFLQIDAPINPGNSGGPLFNMRGEVIGMNTAIVSQAQGIGFTLPINMVKDLLPNLKEHGRLARGWMGVNINEKTQEKGTVSVVVDVFRDSPAAKAGLSAGDQIIGLNDVPITSYSKLLRRIALMGPGTSVSITYQRGNVKKETTLVLVERPSGDGLQVVASNGREDSYGIVTQDLTEKTAKQWNVAAFSGVMVAAISPGSPAELAGLVNGDIILEVNRRPVTDVKSFRSSLERGPKDGVALLKVRRGETVRYVAVKPG